MQVGRTVINFSVKATNGAISNATMGRRDALQEVALDDDDHLPNMREMPTFNRQVTRPPEQELSNTANHWVDEDYQLQLALLQSQMP